MHDCCHFIGHPHVWENVIIVWVNQPRKVVDPWGVGGTQWHGNRRWMAVHAQLLSWRSCSWEGKSNVDERHLMQSCAQQEQGQKGENRTQQGATRTRTKDTWEKQMGIAINLNSLFKTQATIQTVSQLEPDNEDSAHLIRVTITYNVENKTSRGS